MDVRSADPSEVNRLARIWYDGWQDAHANILPEELRRVRTLEAFEQRLHENLANTRVVGPIGAPRGLCIMKGDEFNQLYVAAEARGTGVAQALIADAEQRLAATGAPLIWLACAIGNHRAARFYEKKRLAQYRRAHRPPRHARRFAARAGNLAFREGALLGR